MLVVWRDVFAERGELSEPLQVFVVPGGPREGWGRLRSWGSATAGLSVRCSCETDTGSFFGGRR